MSNNVEMFVDDIIRMQNVVLSSASLPYLCIFSNI